MEHAKKHAQGFSLIELMVVVAIIAIIASVALPAYNAYVTRGKITEATSNLATLRVSMEQYYQDNRNYGTGGTCAVAMPQIGVAVKYFNITCQAPTAASYTITAQGQGGMAGFQYTIDYKNTRTSTISAPATAAGWSTPSVNCWTTNKGGQC